MTFNPKVRTLVVAAMLGISVCLATAARSDAESPQARFPFRCRTGEWNKDFEVSAPKYDRATGKLTWVLEAKKATRLGKYEAFVADSNGVEAATLEVTFTPKGAEHKAKTKITATVVVTNIDAENIDTITIQPKR